mmetsp:Transcript_50774/g.157162  ORF Transcript_50774/g.157162 Transcript_50774/m.157162 type:complete len:406 (+) Transcript_50774:587-1804(+)
MVPRLSPAAQRPSQNLHPSGPAGGILLPQVHSHGVPVGRKPEAKPVWNINGDGRGLCECSVHGRKSGQAAQVIYPRSRPPWMTTRAAPWPWRQSWCRARSRLQLPSCLRHGPPSPWSLPLLARGACLCWQGGPLAPAEAPIPRGNRARGSIAPLQRGQRDIRAPAGRPPLRPLLLHAGGIRRAPLLPERAQGTGPDRPRVQGPLHLLERWCVLLEAGGIDRQQSRICLQQRRSAATHGRETALVDTQGELLRQGQRAERDGQGHLACECCSWACIEGALAAPREQTSPPKLRVRVVPRPAHTSTAGPRFAPPAALGWQGVLQIPQARRTEGSGRDACWAVAVPCRRIRHWATQQSVAHLPELRRTARKALGRLGSPLLGQKTLAELFEGERSAWTDERILVHFDA